jgi:hypothetical protein
MGTPLASCNCGLQWAIQHPDDPPTKVCAHRLDARKKAAIAIFILS